MRGGIEEEADFPLRGGVEEEADFPLIIDIDRANAFMLPGTRYFRVPVLYPGTEVPVEVPGTVCGTAVWAWTGRVTSRDSDIRSSRSAVPG